MTNEVKDELVSETKQSGGGICWVEITVEKGWANEAVGINYPKGFIVSVLPYQRDNLIKKKIGKERFGLVMPVTQKVKHSRI